MSRQYRFSTLSWGSDRISCPRAEQQSSDTSDRSRLALAVGLLFVLVGLAGCSGPGSITLIAADDSRLAEANSRPVGPDARRGRIVSEAVETGAANDTAISITAHIPYFERRDGEETVESLLRDRERQADSAPADEIGEA